MSAGQCHVSQVQNQNVALQQNVTMQNGQVVSNQQIQIQQQQQPQLPQLQPPKAIFDAAIQTISTDRSDGSCQTDNPERTDFQAQAHFEKQGEPIGTQTESSEKCDREVQANIQQESELSPPLVPDPTMKKEISMPNIQSSMAQTPKFYNANQNDRKNKTEKQKKVKLK